MINSMKWDEEMFGHVKVENPGMTDKSKIVELPVGYKHNKMCIEGAYVKVTELPPKSWEIKPLDKTTTVVVWPPKPLN